LIVLSAACSGEVGGGSAFADGSTGGSFAVGGAPDAGGESGTGGVPRGTGGTATGAGGAGGRPTEPPVGGIPMFVAQGHAGRTMISCDDGRTWVADQSDQSWGYCSPESGRDCDHDSGAARGITWGDGWFFATFGWGTPSTVRRSLDAITWETLPVSESSFGGMIYGNGRLVAAARNGKYSDDQGATWHDFNAVELTTWNVRDAAFVPHDGGRFIMASSSDYEKIVVSSDGSSWFATQSAPAVCGGSVPYQGHILYGNGTIVMTGENGVICSSDDGGQSWTSQVIAGGLRANGIWNGSEFMAWNYGILYRSSDGDAWSSTETVPSGIDFSVTAVSDKGTIVGVSGGWDQHYDSQVFYRSEDGVHWDVLPRDAYAGGHPIKAVAFGYGQPSAHCPL